MISFAAFFSRLGETEKTVPAFQSLIDKGVCPDIYFAYTSKEELNMRAFFKHLPIVSLVIFCFAIVLAAAGPGTGASAGSPAEGTVPDIPIFSWKGTDYVPVLFTSDTALIREQLPGVGLPDVMHYWLLRLQAVGDSAYSSPKETPYMECTLITSDGRTIYPDNAFSTDETPTRTLLLYRCKEALDRSDLLLNLDGQSWSPEVIPDETSYSANLFTPGPTATPEPTPAPDPETVRLQAMLEDFRSGEHERTDELPAPEGKVSIIFFDPDEQPETSDEAARTGTDFHGIPAEYLALSAEEADTVYMIYRRESYIGNYSNGGPAFRAFTNIAMIHGTDEQLYRAAVNDPPEKIQAGPGSGAVGEYEPEKAFAAILEKLTGR